MGGEGQIPGWKDLGVALGLQGAGLAGQIYDPELPGPFAAVWHGVCEVSLCREDCHPHTAWRGLMWVCVVGRSWGSGLWSSKVCPWGERREGTAVLGWRSPPGSVGRSSCLHSTTEVEPALICT